MLSREDVGGGSHAREPRKLAIKFGTATLTHYGGVYLVHRFVSRIGFQGSA
jgi:hypothetical protein